MNGVRARGGLAVGAVLALAGCLLAALLIPLAADAGAKRCGGKRATIVLGNGNNKLNAGGGADVIFAGGGNDVIIGGRGKDRICGAGGRDQISGDRGSDRLFGDAGNDTIAGDAGNDEMNGGGGRDRLDGGPGDEPELSGGAGCGDFSLGGAGNDRVDGGPGGRDIASYTNSTRPVSINLRSGSVGGGERERLRGIEDALGGGGNDRISGSSAPNRLDGGPGNDRLQAVGGGDQAFGGAGSDVCVGGFRRENSCGPEGTGNATAVDLVISIGGGNSLVISGRGANEELTLTRAGRRYTVSGTDPVDPASRGACRSSRPTSVICSGRPTLIQADLGGGSDALRTRGIRVTMVADGGGGSDTVTGGSGRDILFSGDDGSADVLGGGGGNDVLFGVNIDHPRQSSGGARMTGGGGSDLLIGGQPCDGDVFDGGRGGNDSASFARVRNSGIVVRARIGGPANDPNTGTCNAGRIGSSIEKLEGSTGPDVLIGDNSANDLLGRAGNDVLNGRGGRDRCIGGGGRDRASGCEGRSSIP
jgi:Ca2+-binding RTX toxin-like protein